MSLRKQWSMSVLWTGVMWGTACTPTAQVCDRDEDCSSDAACVLGDEAQGLCVPKDDVDGGPAQSNSTTPDAGSTTPDAGSTTPDAGSNAPDAGSNAPDAGSNAPDGGSNTPDGGSNAPDGGGNAPDAGGNAPDAGPTELPPFDLDSLTSPSAVDDGEGTLVVHRLTHDVDAEDWFVAPPFSNRSDDFVYVGMVCEGVGTANLRARVWTDLDDAPGFDIACGEDEQRNTVNGQAVVGTVDYRVQVSVLDTAIPTDVRYNLFVTPQLMLPSSVTGVPAPVVEILEATADIAAQDFDTITAPSSTGPQANLVVHDVSFPQGDREDWFPARITTNNQQNFVTGTLTCEGVDGTPSPSPLRATLYRDDEPVALSLFCNDSVQQSSVSGRAVQLDDVLHWRVTVNELAVSSQTRLSYTLY